MLIWAKMGYNIISNISRISRILYHIIYPTKRYYIRYRYAKTYIFPTTGYGYVPWQVEYNSHEDEIQWDPLVVRVVERPGTVEVWIADVA